MLTLSEDGSYFTGYYTYGDSGDSADVWNEARVSTARPADQACFFGSPTDESEGTAALCVCVCVCVCVCSCVCVCVCLWARASC